MAGADTNSDNLIALRENAVNPENAQATVCGACEAMKGKSNKCVGCGFTPYFPREKKSEFRELKYSFGVRELRQVYIEFKEKAEVEREYARLLEIARAEKKHDQEKKSYKSLRRKNKQLKRTIEQNKDFMIHHLTEVNMYLLRGSGGTGTAAAGGGTEGRTAAAGGVTEGRTAAGGGSGVHEEDLRGMGLDSNRNSNVNAWRRPGFTGGQRLTEDTPSTSTARSDEEEMLAMGLGIRRQ